MRHSTYTNSQDIGLQAGVLSILKMLGFADATVQVVAVISNDVVRRTVYIRGASNTAVPLLRKLDSANDAQFVFRNLTYTGGGVASRNRDRDKEKT